MKITTADGTTYRVQFVHSAHDPKHPIQGVPGGLRQIVDHLARSLRRRVTLCEIAVLNPELSTDPETQEQRTTFTVTPVGYGFSICHYFDQFVKAEGRRRAFVRALKSSGLSPDVRSEVSELVGLDGFYESL
jgi:hypothetical protein